MVNWLRQGKVGQPNYDSQTKEIKAHPKATSDVTREVKALLTTLGLLYNKCFTKLFSWLVTYELILWNHHQTYLEEKQSRVSFCLASGLR